MGGSGDTGPLLRAGATSCSRVPASAVVRAVESLRATVATREGTAREAVDEPAGASTTTALAKSSRREWPAALRVARIPETPPARAKGSAPGTCTGHARRSTGSPRSVVIPVSSIAGQTLFSSPIAALPSSGDALMQGESRLLSPRPPNREAPILRTAAGHRITRCRAGAISYGTSFSVPRPGATRWSPIP
jgi:hypothetical protein